MLTEPADLAQPIAPDRRSLSSDRVSSRVLDAARAPTSAADGVDPPR
jgi:hypothetical protein